MELMNQGEELITTIVRALVDDLEGIVIDATPHETGTLLRVHVAPSDIGKLIGKQGRTARSIRTIMGALSTKLQHRFMLDIVEAKDEMYALPTEPPRAEV